MKSNDRRSRRIALVADGVMNPAGNDPDLLAIVMERGWGIIGLPPERLGRPAIARWMAGVADQVREFARHGMTVVAVLDAEETTVIGELERACAGEPAQTVPVHVLSGSDGRELSAFLDRRATREQGP
jgi:phage terminase large subunit-like protein